MHINATGVENVHKHTLLQTITDPKIINFNAKQYLSCLYFRFFLVLLVTDSHILRNNRRNYIIINNTPIMIIYHYLPVPLSYFSW